jgi:hypothetical protein
MAKIFDVLMTSHSQLKGDAAVSHGRIVLNLLLDLVVTKDNTAGTYNYDANRRWQAIGRNRTQRLEEAGRLQHDARSSRPGSNHTSYTLQQIKDGLIIHKRQEADTLEYLVATNQHQGVKNPRPPRPATTLAAIEECLIDSGTDVLQPLTYDQIRLAFDWLKAIGLLREGDKTYKKDGLWQFTLDFSGLYQERKNPLLNQSRGSNKDPEINKQDCWAYAMKLREAKYGTIKDMPSIAPAWLPSGIHKDEWLNWLQRDLNVPNFTREQGINSYRDIDLRDADRNHIRISEIARRTNDGGIIIIKDDDYLTVRCLAFAMAARAIEGMLTASVIYPIHFKPVSPSSLVDWISRTLSLRVHNLEPYDIKKALQIKQLLPVIDAFDIGINEYLYKVLNDLPDCTISFVLSKDSSLLNCLKDKTCQHLFQASISHPMPIDPGEGLPKTILPRKLERFIGRSWEQTELKEMMSLKNTNSQIFVVGESGVGKTELVTNVAHSFCTRNSEYNVILFLTAKQGPLLPSQHDISVQPIQPISTFEELCFKIAQTGGLELPRAEPRNQERELKFYLENSNYTYLFIIDNYETIERSQRDKIWNFFRGLSSNNVKSVFTSRSDDRPDLPIPPLLEEDARELAREQKLRLHIMANADSFINLTEEDISTIIEQCEYLPLAIKWFFYFLNNGYSIKEVIERLSFRRSLSEEDNKHDLLGYMFDDIMKDMCEKDPMSYKLLQILSLFQKEIDIEHLRLIAGISISENGDFEDALNSLVAHSFCICESEKYRLKTLAKLYGKDLLARESKLELKYQNAWINYFLDLISKNGGDDWGYYRDIYNKLDSVWENVCELFVFLANSWKNENSERYVHSKTLWLKLQRFTYLYGYWKKREEWTTALIAEAESQHDSFFHAKLLAARGWLYLLREGDENLSQGMIDFQTALFVVKKISSTGTDDPQFIEVSIIIRLNSAACKIRQKFFNDAMRELLEFKRLWRESVKKQFQTGIIDESNRDWSRHYIRYMLYRGEYFYRCDRFFLAKRHYLRVEKFCKTINWIRFRAKAMERMAYIEMKLGEHAEACERLKTWLKESQKNNDKRRVAFFYRTFALLHVALNDQCTAIKFAEKAKDLFEKLTMNKRVEDMESFIRHHQSN